eukprot:2204616-Rhodomonas_salina.1
MSVAVANPPPTEIPLRAPTPPPRLPAMSWPPPRTLPPNWAAGMPTLVSLRTSDQTEDPTRSDTPEPFC